MTRAQFLRHILPFIIAITTAAANIGLQTQQGIIYGRQTQNSIEYLGIQYARATRWKPPVDLASEIFPNGSFQATSFGPCCPQIKTDIYIPEEDEQCLYLNIYKPIVLSNHTLLPVFVWIHGGAHNHGCSSQAIPLIFNGVFADMFLEALIEEDPTWPTAGNYMYLDMLSALRWIKRNIQDYGGDPNNVSIFGQSAGGLSVTDLGAVRGSAGLYRTAISESGLGSPGTYSSYYNISNALNYSKSVVQRLNCASEDKQKLLACLRNVSIKYLFQAYGSRYTKPIIDNHFFPLYPPFAIRVGLYNNITLIMGNNDYEQPICHHHPFMTANEALATITQSFRRESIPGIIDYYHLDRCSVRRSDNTTRCCDIVRRILMDSIFDCDIRRIFDAFYSKYGPEYANNKLFSYHLNCHPECPIVSEDHICRHSSEIPYVFGTVSDSDSRKSFSCTWNNQTRVFSNGIISHWMNIAATGRPLSDWLSYDPSAPTYFHITPDQNFLSETWNRNCSFFDEMEAEGTRETFENDPFSMKVTFV